MATSQRFANVAAVPCASSSHPRRHVHARRDPKNLARFIGYLNARLTDTINMLTGKRGPLWGTAL